MTEKKAVTTRVAKKSQGYGYKYSDLATINKYIESIGETYFQYLEPYENGYDYIYTVRMKDGKDMPPIRGVRIIEAKLSGKSNPVQEYGSSLTYARRYSLLMAYGLATEDDDAERFTDAEEVKPKNVDEDVDAVLHMSSHDQIVEFCYKHDLSPREINAEFGLKECKTEEQFAEKLKEIKAKYE